METSTPTNAIPSTKITTYLIWLSTFLALAGVAISQLPAADTWWHLAAGDYMLATRTFPDTDPFSFTAGDHPWTNHEWLVEILFSWIYAAGGLAGLYWLKILLVTVSFGVLPAIALYRKNRRFGWLWLCPLIAYAGELSFYADVRAYQVTYLFLSLTVISMLEFRRSGWRFWLALCILMQVAWVNSHGAFILGPAVMGVFLLVGPRRKELFFGTTFTILAACLNPYGASMLLFPFSLMKVDAFSVGLNEWAQPALLGAQLKYTILVVCSSVIVLIRRKHIDWSLFFTTLAFVLLGLKAWRHEPLAALLLCYTLPRLLPEPKLLPKAKLSLACTLLVVGLGFFASRANTPPEKMALLEMFPNGAVKFIKHNPTLPKKLWNPYGWGGFLLWQLGPDTLVFFDGRAHTVYPEEVYRDGYYLQYGEPWLRILTNKGLAVPETPRLDLLGQYEVDLVLCNKFQGDLDNLLRRNMDWFPIFEDFTSTLYLRNTTENRKLTRTFVQP